MVSDCAELRHSRTLSDSVLPRLALCLWALLAASVNASAPPGGYELKLSPAWQGYIKPGGSSELNVQFLAARGGQARLWVQGADVPVDASFSFEPGRTVTLKLPLLHRGGETMKVVARINDETIEKPLALQPLPASSHLVAIVGYSDSSLWALSDLPVENVNVVHLSVAALPHTPAAYRQLSALVLTETALRALAAPQQHALADYLAGCGTLLLPVSNRKTGDALRAAAGCGGRHVLTDIPRSSTDWLPESPPALPGPASLRKLLGGADRSTTISLLIFLVGYAGLLILSARAGTNSLSVLLVPPAAALLAWLAWTTSNPVVRISAWAETRSGDHSARYTALVQVQGTSRRELTLELPPRLGVPATISGAGVTLSSAGQAGGAVEVSLPARLWSRHELVFRGVMPGPLLEVLGRDHSVQVYNPGDETSAPGLVAWRGQRYSLPALAPGQRWRQPDMADAWGDTAEEQILRQRAVDGGTWLLTPVKIPPLELGANPGETTSWMLVQGNSDA